VPAAEADTVASTEVEDSALATESRIASALQDPPPPARAQSWQVVVRGLPCSDTVTTAVLHSTFSQFCCDRLLLRGPLSMHVMRRLTSCTGTAAGVVALHLQEDYEAVFRAARRYLTADCSTSIEPAGNRIQRRARVVARGLRRAVVPQQRTGAVEGGAGSADHLPIQLSLRHDAPEFVPASASLPSQPESASYICPVAQAPDAVQQG